jgi:hypothetical protein
MPRKSFVQDPDTGELVPKDQYVPKHHLNPHHLVMGDRHYDGLAATDGTDISTRTKHREYMKKHGLTTMDDFQGQWKREAERRARYFQGQPGTGAVKRDDVARAIAQLESRRRG